MKVLKNYYPNWKTNDEYKKELIKKEYCNWFTKKKAKHEIIELDPTPLVINLF